MAVKRTRWASPSGGWPPRTFLAKVLEIPKARQHPTHMTQLVAVVHKLGWTKPQESFKINKKNQNGYRRPKKARMDRRFLGHGRGHGATHLRSIRIVNVLAAEEFGYRVKRPDQDSDPGMIGDRMISDVINAELVVADLTDLNPSAFYEQCVLGLTANVLEVGWWPQMARAVRSCFREPFTSVMADARPPRRPRALRAAGGFTVSRERTSSRNYPVLAKPYRFSGLSTRIRLRVASSGAHTASRSNSSPSSGSVPFCSDG